MSRSLSTILVTGGAGFIGSALIRRLINNTNHVVVNVDKLTYAGNLESLQSVSDNPRYKFEKVDISDRIKINDVFNLYKPDAIIHLAAESHVDRSIDGPAEFINTNIIGTYTLLEATRAYLSNNKGKNLSDFKFIHVSTDEVYGSLGPKGLFAESSPYQPHSPYSASKASADHLVRAWYYTFGLPTIITNCSNNYGPYQYPEKLIPVVILNALGGREIPVYGRGDNIRDWLFVENHVSGLIAVLQKAKPGETYTIGGNCELKNIDLVRKICSIMDSMNLDKEFKSFEDLIRFVTDRPGHDQRYAIDSSNIRTNLGWFPETPIDIGLKKTVTWYVENLSWCNAVMKGKYKLERLGTHN